MAAARKISRDPERAFRATFHPRPCARDRTMSCEPPNLHPNRLLFLSQLAFEVEAARFAATKLAARSFRNRLRPKQLDRIWRHSHRCAHGLRDFARDAFCGCHVAHFRGDDQPFRSGALIGSAERHHAPGAKSRHSPGDFLLSMWIDIAVGFDDPVLGAAGDVNFAVSPIGEIAGIEPAAVMDQFTRSGGISVVTTRGRRTAKLKLTFGALAKFALVFFFVDDANFHTRHRSSCADKFERSRIVWFRRNGVAFGCKSGALDAVHFVAGAQRRRGHAEARLSETVDGHQRFAAKAVPREPRDESLKRRSRNWLRSVRRRPPGTQVEALDILIRDFSHAELVCEIRSGANRSAMLVNRPEPAVGPAQERERRHHHEGGGGYNWNK